MSYVTSLVLGDHKDLKAPPAIQALKGSMVIMAKMGLPEKKVRMVQRGPLEQKAPPVRAAPQE
jgi:hypothetical protein